MPVVNSKRAGYESLNEEKLLIASRELAGAHSEFALIYEKYGAPPLWDRPQGFAALILIILEQQVSLASARAAFNKLKERIGDVTPEGVLSLSDEEMKAAYFSRQKAGYARHLAEAILEERISLDSLAALPDDEVRSELKKLKGIGDWSAEVYLLMCLLRPDIMPRGDIALHAAYKELMRLDKRPGPDEFLEIALKWSPHRATAARLLWHFYLSERAAKKNARKR